MKLIFITNYMTHHQLPFCQELYNILGKDFLFVETNSMSQERINMGWDKALVDCPFVQKHEDGVTDKLVLESDVVICGGTHELYVRERMDAGKLTFRYFERLYKTGQYKAFIPTSYIKKYKEHTKRQNSPVYLLCAGAYVPSDFNILGAYKDKMFKWGYYTKVSEEKFEIINSKRASNDKTELLWTGRMLDWKHPELAVKLVKNLLIEKEEEKSSKTFHLTMVGEGPERENVLGLIEEWKLEEYITVKDFMPNEEVRNLMEESDVYLMTSDGNEGWGAVVNEAMDKGMVVVGSVLAGSVPYLIKDRYNGYAFKNGDIKELTAIVKELIEDSSLRTEIGEAAYNTIHELWNAKHAAERIIALSEKLLKDNSEELSGELFEENGPLSKAPIVSPGKGYSYFVGMQ